MRRRLGNMMRYEDWAGRTHMDLMGSDSWNGGDGGRLEKAFDVGCSFSTDAFYDWKFPLGMPLLVCRARSKSSVWCQAVSPCCVVMFMIVCIRLLYEQAAPNGNLWMNLTVVGCSCRTYCLLCWPIRHQNNQQCSYQNALASRSFCVDPGR